MAELDIHLPPVNEAALSIGLHRVSFSDATREFPIDYVLPGLPIGSVGMLCGEGAVGKSFLCLEIGIALAIGTEVAGGLWSPQKIGSVLYVSAEDDQSVLASRIQALKIEFGIYGHLAALVDQRFQILTGVGADLALVAASGDEARFSRILAEMCKGMRLVIIDPLSHFHLGDEQSNRDATRVMRVCQRIAVRAGCAILIVHHMSKTGAQSPAAATSARGASAFSAACRWQLNMQSVSESERKKIGMRDPASQLSLVRVVLAKANNWPTFQSLLARKANGILSHFEPSGAAHPRFQARRPEYV